MINPNFHLRSRWTFNYLNCQQDFLAEEDLAPCYFFARRPCNKNPSAVCQVSLVTFWSCWTSSGILQRWGFPRCHFSRAERLSPAALDSGLIYSQVGNGWCRWWDSAISHQWKWSGACKIEFTFPRKALGCKRLCTQVTFSAQSHLVLVCWPLVNGDSNPRVQMGISRSSIVAPPAA